jgi:adenylate kinase
VEQQTFIFLGPQGCGKGTQVKLFKSYLAELNPNRNIVHFEMGKNLREFAAQGGYTPDLVKKVLADGTLVAYFLSEALFSNYLVEHLRGDEHLLIDGFPRQAAQVAALDSAMQFYGREPVTLVCINISDEEAVARLLGRGRSDDTEESIRKRLAWSRAETLPGIEWFRTNPRYRVVDIDGSGSIEETHQVILSKLNLIA